MVELVVIRHGQAQFGAAGAEGYDQLTDLGARQSQRLGAWLRDMGWRPDRVACGTLNRHFQTLEAMGFSGEIERHGGWNEYDFHDLLAARFGGALPEDVRQDRKTHFRALKETLALWQSDALDGAGESWGAFCDRIEQARLSATRPDAERVLVVSSGGAIAQMTSACLGATPAKMIALNLQLRNTSVNRFIVTRTSMFMNEFNAIPHLSNPNDAALISYS